MRTTSYRGGGGSGSGTDDAHRADTVDAHDASAISFDPATTTYAASTEVQSAIEELDAAIVALDTEVTNAWPAAVNLSTGPSFTEGARHVAADAAGTITVTVPEDSELDILLVQDATGGRAVTFSGVDVWATQAGTAPDTSTRSASDADRFAFETINGTTYGYWLTESIAAAGSVASQRLAGVNAQTGTTYTVVLADEAKLVTLSNAGAITCTLPQDSDVAIPIGGQVHFAQIGAGQVTFAAGTGATVNSTPTAKTRAQYSAVTAIKRAANTWLLVGDLAAS